MIDTRHQGLIGQEAWADHLKDIVQSLGIPSCTMADNVSASVATYCRLYHPQGVRHADMVLLLARAFCSVKDSPSAERVLQSIKPHSRHVARWMEILSELHHFPALLPYFSLGIIRPAEWAGAQLDRMWTLDLSLLALFESERHEMLLYRTIRILIENMYVFWDATHGVGILGLKGMASLNLEPMQNRARTSTIEFDLFGYVEHLFILQKEQRCWHAVPTVLNLDL